MEDLSWLLGPQSHQTQEQQDLARRATERLGERLTGLTQNEAIPLIQAEITQETEKYGTLASVQSDWANMEVKKARMATRKKKETKTYDTPTLRTGYIQKPPSLKVQQAQILRRESLGQNNIFPRNTLPTSPRQIKRYDITGLGSGVFNADTGVFTPQQKKNLLPSTKPLRESVMTKAASDIVGRAFVPLGFLDYPLNQTEIVPSNTPIVKKMPSATIAGSVKATPSWQTKTSISTSNDTGILDSVINFFSGTVTKLLDTYAAPSDAAARWVENRTGWNVPTLGDDPSVIALKELERRVATQEAREQVQDLNQRSGDDTSFLDSLKKPAAYIGLGILGFMLLDKYVFSKK